MNLARERDAHDGRHCQIDDGQGRQDRNYSEHHSLCIKPTGSEWRHHTRKWLHTQMVRTCVAGGMKQIRGPRPRLEPLPVVTRGSDAQLSPGATQRERTNVNVLASD